VFRHNAPRSGPRPGMGSSRDRKGCVIEDSVFFRHVQQQLKSRHHKRDSFEEEEERPWGNVPWGFEADERVSDESGGT